MNENAVQLKELMKAAGLTREAAAALLYVSLDTLHKWLKPATTANRNPCPRWAVELLAYKTKQKIPTMPGEGGSTEVDVPVEPPPAPSPVRKPRAKKAAAEPAPKRRKKAPAK